MTLQEQFKEYESLKLEARRIDTRLEELKPAILEAIPEGKEITTEQGVFSVQKRTTWKYSPAVEATEKELKKMKAEEQAKGTATGTEVPTLYYKELPKETTE
jgi:hypothetical protein